MKTLNLIKKHQDTQAGTLIIYYLEVNGIKKDGTETYSETIAEKSFEMMCNSMKEDYKKTTVLKTFSI